MENPVKAQTQDGKVFDIGDIQVVAEYIDPLYKVAAPASATIGTTGRLDLFDVVPSIVHLPRFSWRWDQCEYSVYVDIENVISAVEQVQADAERV